MYILYIYKLEKKKNSFEVKIDPTKFQKNDNFRALLNL